MGKYKLLFVIGLFLMVAGFGYNYKKHVFDINTSYKLEDIIAYSTAIIDKNKLKTEVPTLDNYSNTVYQCHESPLVFVYAADKFRIAEYEQDKVFNFFYKQEFGWSSSVVESDNLPLVIKEANYLRSQYDTDKAFFKKYLKK